MPQLAPCAPAATRRIAEIVRSYLSEGPKERTIVVKLLMGESFVWPTTPEDMRRQAETIVDLITDDPYSGIREDRGLLAVIPVTADQTRERRAAWAKCVERFHGIRHTGATGVAALHQAIDDREAEFFVAELLLQIGYLAEAYVTTKSRDNGIDVTGFRTGVPLRVRERYVVQVKWYEPGRSVADAEVKHLYASDRTASRLFVTTATFSGPAKRFAAENGVTLVDGTELVHAFLDAVLGDDQ